MATQVFLHLSVYALCILGVNSWRCAKYENYFSQQPDYIDCLWDCCGNSFNRHCCAPIGIIVGCSIVGAVVLAFLTVVAVCWWHYKHASQSQVPRMYTNRHHSHYPMAPSSVTRPAPVMGYTNQEHGPPPGSGYKPRPQEYRQPGDYKQPPRSEKPPLDEYYDRPPQGYDRPPQGYDRPPQGYDRPPQGYDRPPQDYRPGPPSGGYGRQPPSFQRDEKLSLDSHSGERAIDI